MMVTSKQTTAATATAQRSFLQRGFFLSGFAKETASGAAGSSSGMLSVGVVSSSLIRARKFSQAACTSASMGVSSSRLLITSVMARMASVSRSPSWPAAKSWASRSSSSWVVRSSQAGRLPWFSNGCFIAWNLLYY